MDNNFTKDIEENMPELFTPLRKASSKLKLKQNKDDEDISFDANSNNDLISPPFGFTTYLNSNFITSSQKDPVEFDHENNLNENEDDEDDDIDISIDSDLNNYKTIDANAFKKARSRQNTEKIILDQEPEKKEKLVMPNQIEFPSFRICYLTLNSEFEGLGIRLCDNKTHMIKDIETGSPAFTGGLKPGDKILFINDENVEDASYINVVNKLKDAVLASNKIRLGVMNSIEYNLFKKSSNNKEDEIIYELKQKQLSHSNDSLEKQDDNFNPFDDVANDFSFLHYSTNQDELDERVEKEVANSNFKPAMRLTPGNFPESSDDESTLSDNSNDSLSSNSKNNKNQINHDTIRFDKKFLDSFETVKNNNEILLNDEIKLSNINEQIIPNINNNDDSKPFITDFTDIFQNNNDNENNDQKIVNQAKSLSTETTPKLKNRF
jgi:hypothetical protein